MIKLILMIAAVSLTWQANAKTDPNIIREGNREIVKHEACIKFGGFVSNNDKRYYICDGGRYGGYITPGPLTSLKCSLQILIAEAYEDQNGNVSDVPEFLQSASDALLVCRLNAKNWPAVRLTIQKGKIACDEAANQGLSDQYRAMCYLKIAELARFITHD